MAAAEAPQILDESLYHFIARRLHEIIAQVDLTLANHFPQEFDGHFIRHGKRAHRHSRHARRVLDQRRPDTLRQHAHPLMHESRKYPTGVETTTVVDDDG